MNTFLVFAVALGVVSADVGLGYHYKVPQTSYGIPSYQTSGVSTGGNYNTGYSGSSGSGYNYKGQSVGQGYHGVNSGYQGYTGVQSAGTGYQGGSASGVGYQSTGYQTSGQYYPSVSSTASSSVVQPSYQVGGHAGQAGYHGSYQYQTSNQYQSSSENKYQQHYQIQQQPAQVFKHFYVHAAPEEPEVVRPRHPVVLPAPQKHYKIIFIKTPSQSVGGPQFVPVQQQNEEKTIVYVLVKKPEEYHDVVVPKVDQKPPSKPEVYFIKYNSKEDSQAVINNIVNDYNSKGQSVSFANAGDNAQAVTSNGYYSGQSVHGTGVSSTPSYSGISSSTGSYSEQANFGVGQAVNSQTENQLSSTFGATFGNGSAGSLNVATAEASGSSLGSGYESGVSSGYSSSTANYDSANTISTSQGVPHETYGVPKFKST